MKRNFTFLLTALLLLTGMNVWAQSRTSTTDVLNRELTGVTGSSYTSWEGKTSNSDAVYAGQSAGGYESIQLRSNNSNSGIITTASGGTVTNVTITWNENTADGRTLNVYGCHSAYTSPTALYDETQGTLLGTIVKGTNIELEITDSYEYLGLRSASGAMYLQEINITWNTEGGTPQETVATPTFNPQGGTYSEAVSVTISCATEGATLYYTTDGSNPAEDGIEYTSAINISETTTVKAIAMKEGYLDSEIVTATYIITETPGPSLITIAEARALANNEYALVQGVVTFIDGRNVYIQDETAGIDLFLNNNTVPTSLALGDNVRAYGKHAIYNGLVELSGINGGNADEFSILSSGNPLPMVVKTIAEVLEGGADALQCTRVKIESATIGAINTSGNTLLTQDGSTINIYKIPALTGIEEGNVVDVISVIGYFNVPQLRVALADDVTLIETPSSSSLTVSLTTLSGFEYEFEAGGPSEILYFTVSGDQLTNNVSVIPSEHFEVSTQIAEQFQPENPAMIYIPESGSFYDIQICVRLKAGLEVGTYNEQIAVVSDETNTVYVNVSGTVTGGTPTPPDPPTPTEGEYVRISDLSQLIAGSYVILAARYNETSDAYVAIANTLTNGKPATTAFTSAINGTNEIIPESIANNENNFYWTVGINSDGYTFTNANGDMIGYGTSGTNFMMNGERTIWTVDSGISDTASLVPEYYGFKIVNATADTRAFAIRFYNESYVCGAYSTSNLNNSYAGEYNYFLDLFVKTEGIEPPMPTVATPTFTPEAGTYTEEQNVSITCATEGADIFYTTDGTDPTASSTPYTGPFIVSETTTVKAIATKTGYNNSAIASATYTIQNGGTTTVTLFNQDWEGEMNGWTFINEDGEMSWTVAQYSGNHYAYANGYSAGSAHANVDWCISPAFDLSNISNAVLTFRTATKFTGPTIKVFFSSNYDGVNPDTPGTVWDTLTGFALSQGNYEWVESGPVSLNYNNPNCYIAFKYTSTDTEAAAWEVDDIMLVGQSSTTSPVVNVTPLTLTGFTYMEGNGPSLGDQHFTVSGFNLSSDIIITEAEHFEISLTSGNDFNPQSFIPLTPVDGIVEETPIYVRLKAGLAVSNYNENVTISYPNVDNIQVACSGTVTAQPVPGDDYIRIFDVSELADGNRIVFAARYNENATEYYAMSNAASGKPEGVLFTSTTSGSNEILPASIIGLEDNFYWTVNVTADGHTFTNAAGQLIGWSTSTNFSPNENADWSIEIGTSEGSAMVPNYTGFVITNVFNPIRAFALNSNHNFGPYSTQNIASENYNFFLDIFMQGEGGPCTVAAPTFNPAGGTYYGPQEVTISCPTDGATIYYRVSENGPWIPYTGAITIDESTTIWAYAVNEDCNDSPVVSAQYVIQDDLVIIFNQDWEEDWHGWTEYCEMGDSLWHIGSYQGNHYANANGYNHPASIDWLISPAFDLNSYSGEVLSFRTAKNYNGPDLKVYFSSEYDGGVINQDEWQELDGFELSQGGWNWVPTEISLEGYNGDNCHIAFRYNCNEEEGAAAWEVDDIMLTAGGGATPTPTLTATPNSLSGFSYVVGNSSSNNSQSYILIGANLEGEGNILVSIEGEYEISLDNESFGTDPLELPYANGQLVGQPITIHVRLVEGLEVGPYPGHIDHVGGGASAVVTLSGNVHGDNESNIVTAMPLYIQGNNGSNNNRVPVAIQVTLLNLEPNTTYRYTNQLVDGNDGPETAGAGNVIYVNSDGFYRSTSPSLETEGNYGEFTTSANGSQIVWFMNEPTANARFTPGNHVYLRIRINDGHNGTSVAQTFTSLDYATVLNFGNDNDEYSGSAFYVKSNESPMGFALLYTDVNHMDRPVYSTSIETTGVDYGSINQYADFYKELVAGKDGWFGGIIPNKNETGINHIWIYDLYGGSREYETVQGQWAPEANTVNPNAGLDAPIFIDLTDDGVEEALVANVKVWNANNEFVIENGDNAHYSMTVYNILGQPVMTKQINAGSTERISHSLASGVYVIRLQNSQSNVSVKVIVR